MSADPLTSREIDQLRDRADAFIRDLNQEYYDHNAGLKDTFEVERIYEEYAELTTLETASRLADGPERMWRFACEGYLGNLTREHQARAARVEAELEATVDGRTMPYRMLRVAEANEPDRDARRRMEEERVRLLDEHLNPVHLEAAQIDREAVRALGVDNYYELYRRFGFRLDELADECREVLDETEQLWEREGDRLFRDRLGIGLTEARPWDLARLFRAPEMDELFPSDKMLPALDATLRELGIDMNAQPNVHLDLELRPNKTPRPFCAPIDLPGKVMLVIQPIGGRDDWEALFHEAGHTQHFAHTDESLSVDDKRLGDPGTSEGWAMLLQHLVTEPAWLKRRLDVGRMDAIARDGAVSLLFFVRRYAAKLLYEIEFFQADDPKQMRDRYDELLSDALKLPVNPQSYLDDIDGSFYVTGYLRSWAFEAQFRDFLRSELGSEWFRSRDAGDLLRELWSLGERLTPEEILKDVSGAKLEMASVVERVREGLAAR